MMRISGPGASSRSTRGGVGEMCLCYGFISVVDLFLCHFMSLVGGGHMFGGYFSL